MQPVSNLVKQSNSYYRFNPLKRNNTTERNGFEYRWGVGRTDAPPDTVIRQRSATKPVFLKITAPNQQFSLPTGIENTTSIWLHRVKITNISGTPNVVAIKFKIGTNQIKTHTSHNIPGLSEDVRFINGTTGTAIDESWQEPVLLSHFKHAYNCKDIVISLWDDNNNQLTFNEVYIWLYFDTMNWQ